MLVVDAAIESQQFGAICMFASMSIWDIDLISVLNAYVRDRGIRLIGEPYE